jgi:hypothetical protein
MGMGMGMGKEMKNEAEGKERKRRMKRKGKERKNDAEGKGNENEMARPCVSQTLKRRDESAGRKLDVCALQRKEKRMFRDCRSGRDSLRFVSGGKG